MWKMMTMRMMMLLLAMQPLPREEGKEVERRTMWKMMRLRWMMILLAKHFEGEEIKEERVKRRKEGRWTK
jgi:hypothetical protein